MRFFDVLLKSFVCGFNEVFIVGNLLMFILMTIPLKWKSTLVRRLELKIGKRPSMLRCPGPFIYDYSMRVLYFVDLNHYILESFFRSIQTIYQAMNLGMV